MSYFFECPPLCSCQFCRKSEFADVKLVWARKTLPPLSAEEQERFHQVATKAHQLARDHIMKFITPA